MQETYANFQLYSAYYDLLYQDKNYQAEAEYVYKKLIQYKPSLHSVLELGCGTGNHAQFLSKKGLQITGVERSASMVAEANKKQISNFFPVEGDIRRLDLENTFDAAIALFHVISYLNNNNDLISCFKSVHRHLADDGVFLFDVWYTPAVLTQKPEVRIKRLENEHFRITRIAEPEIFINQSIVNVNYEIFIEDKQNSRLAKFQEVHPMRHFTINELHFLAKITGFEIIEYREFMSDNTLNKQTWGAVFILKSIQ